MEEEADGELVKAAGFSRSPRRRAGGCSHTAGNQTDQKIQLEMEREVGEMTASDRSERKRSAERKRMCI